jgi:hypothetical protein
MSHTITNSSLVDVLTNLNLKETQNNSTLHSLLQKLVTTSDQNPSPSILKQDPTSDDSDTQIQDTPKKRKFELERGEEELQNICKVQRMQRNRESAARSRMRKREYIEELEAKLSSMANEANQAALLKERIARLESDNQVLRLHLEKFLNQPQQIPLFPQTYQQQPQLQIQSPIPQIIVFNTSQEGVQEREQVPTPPLSSVPNTPPKSPEELPSSSFSKYATLKEFSLQMESKEATIPLLILVQIWILLLGLTKNLTQNTLIPKSTWSSCDSGNSYLQILTVSQDFEPTPALTFQWASLNYFSLPP